VTRPWQRKFLGFSFTGEQEPRRRIAPKAIARFKQRIREQTRRTRGISLAQMVKEIATYLRDGSGTSATVKRLRCCKALNLGYAADFGRWCGSIVKILKSILSWSDVVTSGWKLRLPIIPEDEQRWFTEEEAERIIHAAEGQYRVLFRVAYATGMRAGELFGLHVDDFDFGAGTVRVLRSTFRNIEDTPKTKKGRRTMYVDSRTLEEVRGFWLVGRPVEFS
jgi:integrase